MTKYCKRPAVVYIPPMILTKCNKTCNYYCNTVPGCNPSIPPQPNKWSDSYCNGGWSDADLINWCKTSSSAVNCQTMCYNLGVYLPACPPQCVDSDPINCPKLAATKGCFSQYIL